MLALTLLFAFADPPKITISKETTYITGPLRADGMVDYLAYVNGPLKEIKPEDNAAYWLMKAAGPKELWSSADEFCRRLGMNPLPERGDYISTYLDYDFAKNKTTDSDRISKVMQEGQYLSLNLWTRKDKPELAEWLDRSAMPLELIKLASRKSRCRFPAVPIKGESSLVASTNGHSIGFSVVYSQCALTLAHRVLLRAGEGDLVGAFDDLDAVHRLAGVVATEPTGASTYSPYIEGEARRAERLIVESGKLTAEQSETRAQWLASRPPTPTDLGFRRLRTLDMMQTVCGRGVDAVFPGKDFSDELLVMVFGFHRKELREVFKDQSQAASACEIGMRRINWWFDRLEAALKEPSYRRRKALLAEMNAQLTNDEFGEKRKPIDLKNAKDVGIALGDHLSAPYGYVDRLEGEVERRQVVLAYALSAYKRRHNEYPKSLDPKLLGVPAEVVVDPYSDQPFVDRMKGGKRQIISVGRDEKVNDKPKPADVKSGWDVYTYNDDLIFELP